MLTNTDITYESWSPPLICKTDGHTFLGLFAGLAIIFSFVLCLQILFYFSNKITDLQKNKIGIWIGKYLNNIAGFAIMFFVATTACILFNPNGLLSLGDIASSSDKWGCNIIWPTEDMRI